MLMLDVKDNMRGNHEGSSVYCEVCDLSTAESRVNAMNCPWYVELRVGKDMGSDEERERMKYNK